MDNMDLMDSMDDMDVMDAFDVMDVIDVMDDIDVVNAQSEKARTGARGCAYRNFARAANGWHYRLSGLRGFGRH